VTTEALERCIAYFNTIYPVLLGSEAKANQTHLLGDSGRALSSGCDSIRTDAVAIRTLIQVLVHPLNDNIESQCIHICRDSPQEADNHGFYVFFVVPWMEIKISFI
jgi:hypothetical protein